MSASKEQFAVAHAAISGHRRHAKTIYDNIARPSTVTITRDNSVSEETKELGRFHNAATEDFKAEQTATNRTLRQIQLAAATRGITVPDNIRNPDMFIAGMELEQEGKAESAGRVETSDASLDRKKDYVLTGPPAAAPSVSQYWILWARLEKLKPGANQNRLRHALTQKALGCHPQPGQMTPEQLRKMIDVFSAMIRDSTLVTL